MDEYTSVINAFEELIKFNSGMIEAIGDCPNFEIPVNSEPVFWKNIASMLTSQDFTTQKANQN